ncbi:hypothetical protein FRB95_013633 [Tulasnella sp. JGI-2019a]|nr:hypothetical protein FRB95_013633 [Tulasnella sp. JGI-2019a]
MSPPTHRNIKHRRRNHDSSPGLNDAQTERVYTPSVTDKEDSSPSISHSVGSTECAPKTLVADGTIGSARIDNGPRAATGSSDRDHGPVSHVAVATGEHPHRKAVVKSAKPATAPLPSLDVLDKTVSDGGDQVGYAADVIATIEEEDLCARLMPIGLQKRDRRIVNVHMDHSYLQNLDIPSGNSELTVGNANVGSDGKTNDLVIQKLWSSPIHFVPYMPRCRKMGHKVYLFKRWAIQSQSMASLLIREMSVSH